MKRRILKFWYNVPEFTFASKRQDCDSPIVIVVRQRPKKSIMYILSVKRPFFNEQTESFDRQLKQKQQDSNVKQQISFHDQAP